MKIFITRGNFENSHPYRNMHNKRPQPKEQFEYYANLRESETDENYTDDGNDSSDDESCDDSTRSYEDE